MKTPNRVRSCKQYLYCLVASCSHGLALFFLRTQLWCVCLGVGGMLLLSLCSCIVSLLVTESSLMLYIFWVFMFVPRRKGMSTLTSIVCLHVWFHKCLTRLGEWCLVHFEQWRWVWCLHKLGEATTEMVAGLVLHPKLDSKFYSNKEKAQNHKVETVYYKS